MAVIGAAACGADIPNSAAPVGTAVGTSVHAGTPTTAVTTSPPVAVTSTPNVVETVTTSAAVEALPPELVGRRWVSYPGDDSAAGLPFVEFFADGAVVGFDGCNRFAGHARMAGPEPERELVVEVAATTTNTGCSFDVVAPVSGPFTVFPDRSTLVVSVGSAQETVYSWMLTVQFPALGGRWSLNGLSIKFDPDGSVSVLGCGVVGAWNQTTPVSIELDRAHACEDLSDPARALFDGQPLAAGSAVGRDELLLFPADGPGPLGVGMRPSSLAAEAVGVTSDGALVLPDYAGCGFVVQRLLPVSVAAWPGCAGHQLYETYWAGTRHDVLEVTVDGEPNSWFWDLRPGHEGELLGRCCGDPSAIEVAGGAVIWSPGSLPEEASLHPFVVPADIARHLLELSWNGDRTVMSAAVPSLGLTCAVQWNGAEISLVDYRILSDGRLAMVVAMHVPDHLFFGVQVCGDRPGFSELGQFLSSVALGESSVYFIGPEEFTFGEGDSPSESAYP